MDYLQFEELETMKKIAQHLRELADNHFIAGAKYLNEMNLMLEAIRKSEE